MSDPDDPEWLAWVREWIAHDDTHAPEDDYCPTCDAIDRRRPIVDFN